MDLKRLQAEQARLYTDAAARAQADVSPQVERFARSLLRKRLGEVRRALPRTFVELGDEAERRFFAYAARRPLGARHPHLTDAVRFAEQVVGTEIARFEAAGLRAWMGETPRALRVRGGWVFWWRRRGRLRRFSVGRPAVLVSRA